MVQPRQFPWAEVEADDVGEVAPAETRVEAKRRRFTGSDWTDILNAATFRFMQGIDHGPEIDARPHGPRRIYEGQAGPVVPFLSQVESVAKARQTRMHRTIADQQYGVRVRFLGRTIERQWTH